MGKSCASPWHVLRAECCREEQRVALAVYGVSALVNHACSPNVTLCFRGGALAVRAGAPLAVGDRLLHCYGPQVGISPVHQPGRLSIRRSLKARWLSRVKAAVEDLRYAWTG